MDWVTKTCSVNNQPAPAQVNKMTHAMENYNIDIYIYI